MTVITMEGVQDLSTDILVTKQPNKMKILINIFTCVYLILIYTVAYASQPSWSLCLVSQSIGIRRAERLPTELEMDQCDRAPAPDGCLASTTTLARHVACRPGEAVSNPAEAKPRSLADHTTRHDRGRISCPRPPWPGRCRFICTIRMHVSPRVGILYHSARLPTCGLRVICRQTYCCDRGFVPVPPLELAGSVDSRVRCRVGNVWLRCVSRDVI
jgi:hypothetical protein